MTAKVARELLLASRWFVRHPCGEMPPERACKRQSAFPISRLSCHLFAVYYCNSLEGFQLICQASQFYSERYLGHSAVAVTIWSSLRWIKGLLIIK